MLGFSTLIGVPEADGGGLSDHAFCLGRILFTCVKLVKASLVLATCLGPLVSFLITLSLVFLPVCVCSIGIVVGISIWTIPVWLFGLVLAHPCIEDGPTL